MKHYATPALYTRRDLQAATLRREVVLERWGRYGLAWDMEPLPGALIVQHCSATKGDPSGGPQVPEKFYVSQRLRRFYAWCGARKQRYAILSDGYGIHFDDEQRPFYDIHPSMLEEAGLHANGTRIRDACAARNIPALHYVASPPTTAVPYLIMLFASGVPFTYATSVPKG